MPTKEQNYIIEIRGKTDQAVKQVKALSKEVTNLKKQLDKGITPKNIDQTTRSFATLTKHVAKLAAIYSAANLGKDLIQTMNDLEQSLLDVSKTTGLTGDGLQKLSDELDDLALKLHGISISELQQIAATAGQLGVASDDIGVFTEQVAKISVAVKLSAEDTATNFARLANATHTPIEKIENLGSAVNDLSQSTTATVEDVLHYSKNIASLSSAANVSAEDVLALSATLRDVGATAESGGSAVRRIFIEMSSDSNKFAKAVGADMKDFAKTVKEEPVKAFEIFLKHYRDLAAEDREPFLENLKLKSSEITNVVGLMSGGISNLTANVITSRKAFKDNISIQKEYEITSVSLNAHYKDFTNSLELFAKKLSVAVIPALNKALDGVTDFINNLDADSVESFATTLASMIETLGDLTRFFLDTGKEISAFLQKLAEIGGVSTQSVVGVVALVGALFKYQAQLGTLITALGTMKTVSGGLSSVFDTTAKSLGLLSVAIGVVLYDITLWARETDNFKDSLKIMDDELNVTNGYLSVTRDEFTKLDGATRKAFTSALNDQIKSTTKNIKVLTERLKEQNANIYPEKEYIKALEAGIRNATLNLKLLQDRKEAMLDIDKDLTEESREQTKATEEQAKAIKQATEEQEKYVEALAKSSQKRVVDSEVTIAKLRAGEVKLYNDLAQLEKGLSDIRTKYSAKRTQLSLKVSNDEHTALLQGKTNLETYHADILRARELQAQAVSAIEAGKVKEAEQYAEQAYELTKKWRNQEVTDTREVKKLNKETHEWELKSIEEVGATRSQTRAATAQGMRDYEALMLQVYQAEETEEINNHNLKIADKQREIAINKLKIETEIQMLEILKEIVEKSTGQKLDISFDAVHENLKQLDGELNNLEKQKRLVPFGANTAPLTANVNEALTATQSKKAEINVYGDLEPYQKEVVDSIRSTEGERPIIPVDSELTPYEQRVLASTTKTEEIKPIIEVDANTEPADTKVETTQKDVEDIAKIVPTVDVDEAPAMASIVRIADNVTSLALIEPRISVTVVSNVAKVKAEILELNHIFTVSRHNVSSNVLDVRSQINGLNNLNTVSYHDVYYRYHRANGGMIPHLANGGVAEYPRMSGKIAGHDLSGKDDVHAKLTRGEFVNNVRSVDYYGQGLFEMLNQRMIPKSNLPAFAAGGSVGGASVSPSNKTVNLNLNVGGKSYATIADEDVANALERVLKKEF